MKRIPRSLVPEESDLLVFALAHQNRNLESMQHLYDFRSLKTR